MIFFCLLATLAALGARQKVYALDPHRALSQYTHSFWGIEQGFPGGTVYAIAQTNDGYLWIGTEKGLVRFDGIHFDVLPPSNSALLASEPILGLITDAEGSLWIRLRGTKIIRYRNGKFEDVLTDLRRPDFRITAMSRGSDGQLLLSTLGDGTLRFTERGFVSAVPKTELPNTIIISIAETPSGEIWMGTRDAGLYQFNGQKTSAVTSGLPDRKINSLLPDGAGNLWVGTDKGIIHWNGTELNDAATPAALAHSQVLTMLKDRQSNIWIGTESDGLLRRNANNVTLTEKNDFPAGKMVTALFEDREGNLWVGSPQGIERLRDNAFVTYSVTEGLPSERSGALYTEPEAKTWFAPLGGGLYWLKENQVGGISAEGLDKDIVYSIAGSKKDVWIGRQRGGLTHLNFDGAQMSARTYTQAEGLAQNSVYTIYQSRDNSIWAGTLSGGASRLKDGKFTNYTTADGLTSNTINAIAEGADDAIWFATPGGLNSLLNERWQKFTVRDGLPSESINCLLADSGGVLWLGTAKGLAYLKDGRIQFDQTLPAPLRESILGVAEDLDGSLWIATASHVLQTSRETLLRGLLRDADIRVFGIADGLDSSEGVKRSRSVIADSAGRIWFSMNRGISVVDPRSLKSNEAPALVQVNNLTADGIQFDLQKPILIGSSHQRIIINFAGLSLSAPERVRFRYKLEGFDDEWSEPTASAEAIYTNLNPGFYRFRVTASTSDGLWNAAEATIQFDIEPMIWQNWWFRLLCLLAVVLLIFLVFRLRLRRTTAQLNLRFEERLAERTLIAQELHDSLLQGFVGASMQLDVAIAQLPENSPSKSPLTHILEVMRGVIGEGRNTVRGLRSSHQFETVSLEDEFSEFWQKLAATHEIIFRVVIEGTPRALRPPVRDEVYRIGCEALINAFRHSKGRNVEIEIEYAAKYFKILISDDGFGIDPTILRAGRENHFGLSGMRERADRIGARFKVSSRAGAGTGVELIVPHHIAFETESARRRLLKWLPVFSPRKAGIRYSKRK